MFSFAICLIFSIFYLNLLFCYFIIEKTELIHCVLNLVKFDYYLMHNLAYRKKVRDFIVKQNNFLVYMEQNLKYSHAKINLEKHK